MSTGGLRANKLFGGPPSARANFVALARESLTATFGYAIRIMSRLFLSLTFFLSFSVLFSSCCFCVLYCWDLFLLRVTFFSLLSTASFLEQPPGRARGKE